MAPKSGSRWSVPCGLVLAVAACSTAGPREAVPVQVAAAADLTDAFTDLGRAFELETGTTVRFSFGSTGLLAKQIGEGAPFDMFAAANVSFVDAVVGAGVCDGDTKQPYARGRIAIWTKRDVAAPAKVLTDLADPRFKRVAIANPEHAPYGQAAKQAFLETGLWETLEPRLVYGENVRQALQFAETGNVDAAVVALALVALDRDNPWVLVDENQHRPIDQALVVCNRGGNREGGQAFAAFVASEVGRAVMQKHGFLLPGDAREELP